MIVDLNCELYPPTFYGVDRIEDLEVREKIKAFVNEGYPKKHICIKLDTDTMKIIGGELI